MEDVVFNTSVSISISIYQYTDTFIYYFKDILLMANTFIEKEMNPEKVKEEKKEQYFSLPVQNQNDTVVFNDLGEEKDNPFNKAGEKPKVMMRYSVTHDGKEKFLDTASIMFNIAFAKAHKKLLDAGAKEGILGAEVEINRAGAGKKTTYQLVILNYVGK